MKKRLIYKDNIKMKNKVNDEIIQGSHNFEKNGTNFTILILSGYDRNIVPCFFFKNPEQSKLDEFLNGTAYLFYSFDFIQQRLDKHARNQNL
jgi:hypothetical protein